MINAFPERVKGIRPFGFIVIFWSPRFGICDEGVYSKRPQSMIWTMG